ncbi:hypothetical protein LXL04_025356 [Taraxacum kok-saghyz]
MHPSRIKLPASKPTIRPVRQEPVAPLQSPSLCHLPRRCFNDSASRTSVHRRSPTSPPVSFSFTPNCIPNRSDLQFHFWAVAILIDVKEQLTEHGGNDATCRDLNIEELTDEDPTPLSETLIYQGQNNRRPGMPTDLAPEMLKTATDMMKNMPPEDLQKISKMALNTESESQERRELILVRVVVVVLLLEGCQIPEISPT